MKPQFIFSLLRISVNIIFQVMIFLTVVITIVCVLRIAGVANQGLHRPTFTHEVIAFGKTSPQPVSAYSADKVLKYLTIPDHFKVEVEPRSGLGYFSFFNKLVHLGFGIAVLWLFKKIFGEKDLGNSFNGNVYRRLVSLSILFVVSDVFTLISYFILNSLIHKSLSEPYFELATDVGHGVVTGLMVYAIAIVYRKGIVIQQENELTV